MRRPRCVSDVIVREHTESLSQLRQIRGSCFSPSYLKNVGKPVNKSDMKMDKCYELLICVFGVGWSWSLADNLKVQNCSV